MRGEARLEARLPAAPRPRAPALLLLLLALRCTAAGGSTLRQSSESSGARKLLRRDVPRFEAQQQGREGLGSCNNTVQGRWLLTDSQGFVCQRSALDVQSGCCSTGERFTCETCNMEHKCCEVYEHCVSCCQAPQHSNASLLLEVFRGPDRPETGRWGSVFEYCRNKCRTSSRSTVHENAYLSPLHHCFSASGAPPSAPRKPITPSPPVPQLPAGAIALAGAKGAACAAVCEAAGRRCAPEHFASLNDCNRLREHFACEAGCEADAPAPESPGYVDATSPKPMRPTMCLTLGPAQLGQAACDAANAQVQRLCPCVAVSA